MLIKLEKTLNWLSAVSGKNYHTSHKRFIKLPNRRTPSEHLAWLEEAIAKVEKEHDETCPYSLHYHDLTRWRDRNPELFVGELAKEMNITVNDALGIDPIGTTSLALFVATEMSVRLKRRLDMISEDTSEFKVLAKFLDKYLGRIAGCAEALNRLQIVDAEKMAMSAVYESAANAIALSKADPSASPQMRQWMEHLLMAALAKLDPVQSSGVE